MEHFQAHAAQANRNIMLFNQLDFNQIGNGQWNEWQVVTAYYAVLHLFHASIALSLLNHPNLSVIDGYDVILQRESRTGADRQLTTHLGLYNYVIIRGHTKRRPHSEIHQIPPFDLSISVCKNFNKFYALTLKARYLEKFKPDPTQANNFIDTWITPKDVADARQYLSEAIVYLPTRHPNNQPPLPAFPTIEPLIP
jgi:hypothetical protein